MLLNTLQAAPTILVWVTNNSTNEPGTVVSPAETPRSCIVETNNGQVKKNQQHLTLKPIKQHPCVQCDVII